MTSIICDDLRLPLLDGHDTVLGAIPFHPSPTKEQSCDLVVKAIDTIKLAGSGVGTSNMGIGVVRVLDSENAEALSIPFKPPPTKEGATNVSGIAIDAQQITWAHLVGVVRVGLDIAILNGDDSTLVQPSPAESCLVIQVVCIAANSAEVVWANSVLGLIVPSLFDGQHSILDPVSFNPAPTEIHSCNFVVESMGAIKLSWSDARAAKVVRATSILNGHRTITSTISIEPSPTKVRVLKADMVIVDTGEVSRPQLDVTQVTFILAFLDGHHSVVMYPPPAESMSAVDVISIAIDPV